MPLTQCQSLSDKIQEQVEPAADEAADQSTNDDDVPDDSSNHIEINIVSPAMSMSAEDFFRKPE